MPKKPLYFTLGVAFLTITSAAAFYIRHERSANSFSPSKCPFEIKTCPDGTAVSRVGANCNFALCPGEDAATHEPVATVSSGTPSQATAPTASTTKEVPIAIATVTKTPPQKTAPAPTQPKHQPKTTPANTSSGSSFIGTVIKKIGIIASDVVLTITSVVAPQQSNFTEEKYTVKDGNIVNGDNTILYALPSTVTNGLSNPNATDTQSHTVNVIPVGEVPPVLNAIPITGQSGKYYLSENTFGDPEQCIFSNKIFILDTHTNQVSLLYQEDNTTLDRDDPRACNSEIFLLATENEKLILKYHTVGTNSLCDSAWSEPDKTWYLDVTNFPVGMKKYIIPDELSSTAEQQENACRAGLPQ
jgi:hypothetical protein